MVWGLGSSPCLPGSPRTVALCWDPASRGQTLSLGDFGASPLPPSCFPRTSCPHPGAGCSCAAFPCGFEHSWEPADCEASHLRPEGPFLSCPQETLHFLLMGALLVLPAPQTQLLNREPGPGGGGGREERLAWCLRSRAAPTGACGGRAFSRTRAPPPPPSLRKLR